MAVLSICSERTRQVLNASGSAYCLLILLRSHPLKECIETESLALECLTCSLTSSHDTTAAAANVKLRDDAFHLMKSLWLMLHDNARVMMMVKSLVLWIARTQCSDAQ